jgi:CheY-like chemotaxis protein
VTEQYLVQLGYTVTRHARPEEALRAFDGTPAHFDLVVTDQAMPGTAGTDLAAALRRIRPDLPIVIASGFLDPTTEETARRIGVNELLHKPITIEMLGRAVARALGGVPKTQDS